MSSRTSHRNVGGTALRLAALTLTAAAAACGPDVQVRTVAAPEAATLAGRKTFTIVESKVSVNGDTRVSANGNGNGSNGHDKANGNGNGNGSDDAEIDDGVVTAFGSPIGIADPMINNQITARAVRDEIKAAWEARGYRYTTKNPDFEIRYQAALAPILDIQTYDVGYGGYGYYGYRPYGYYGYTSAGYCCDGYGGYGYAVGTYDRGTVVIDAVDPKSDKLLWRGQGTAGAYNEPKRFMKELRHAVRAVARKFPVNQSPIPYSASR
jgi:hypothetical protein